VIRPHENPGFLAAPTPHGFGVVDREGARPGSLDKHGLFNFLTRCSGGYAIEHARNPDVRFRYRVCDSGMQTIAPRLFRSRVKNGTTFDDESFIVRGGAEPSRLIATEIGREALIPNSE
jgi:hypothetical protein